VFFWYWYFAGIRFAGLSVFSRDTETIIFLELYRGGTGSFFGIGILSVSDLLDFRYFGRYRSPPFLYTSPLSSPLFSKRGSSFSKRGPLPPF
jgi:hypothetical protein